ncbi:uncharacterized protein LOC120323427 [Pipra filicauda]|uniref:Uncharacterized protein LOC120323427 n=1 Tax=Pipra filicauda TaxID=649802 RepID=A0A7R5K8X8_9PASS|nr:uncharacterized protein LOC120323427 [Pipra filicauda]
MKDRAPKESSSPAEVPQVILAKPSQTQMGGTVAASGGRLCDLYSLQLGKDRSRAEEYLRQRLLYPKDPEATVREVTLRFISEPQPLESLFRQPGPHPCSCTNIVAQPWGCPSPSCHMLGLNLPPPPLPMQLGLMATLLSSTPLSYWWFLGSSLLRGRRAGPGATLLGARWGAEADGALSLGVATRHLQDQSTEKLDEICSALQPLKTVGNDFISYLATQAILILTALNLQQNPRFNLQALFFWCY